MGAVALPSAYSMTTFTNNWLDEGNLRLRQLFRDAAGIHCRQREKPVEYLTSALNRSIAGQHAAVADVIKAVRDWKLKPEPKEPWMIILVGPTGTGKTFTADLIAQSLLRSLEQVPGSSQEWAPDGLLLINGYDFATDDSATSIRLKRKLIDHLRRCSGRGVIVLDEFHKIAPTALNGLRPLFTGSQSVTAPDKYGVESVASASGAFVIMTTDVLTDTMGTLTAQAVTESGGDMAPEGIDAPQLARDLPSLAAATVDVDGTAVPSLAGLSPSATASLRSRVRQLLRDHLASTWKELGLSSLANAVIPFLPFTTSDVASLLTLYINQMERSAGQIDHPLICGSLSVSKHLASVLASLDHVDYDAHVFSHPKGATGEVAVLFSSWGARRIADSDDSPLPVIRAAVRAACAEGASHAHHGARPAELRAVVEPEPGSTTKVKVRVEAPVWQDAKPDDGDAAEVRYEAVVERLVRL